MTMTSSSYETPVTDRRKRGRKKALASTTLTKSKRLLEPIVAEDEENSENNFLDGGHSLLRTSASTTTINGSVSREEFTRACRDVSDVEFWKTQHATALPGLILDASTQTTHGNGGSMVLDGHAKALLRESTAMISKAAQIHEELKAAAATTTTTTNESSQHAKQQRQTQYNLLLVAIHSTSAVWRRTPKTNNVIKVLYHALRCMEYAIPEATTEDRAYALANLACRAYATISTILTQSTVSLSDETKSSTYVSFPHDSHPKYAILFPTPKQEETTNEQRKSSKLPLDFQMDKLAAVAVHSILIMSKICLHASRNFSNLRNLLDVYAKHKILSKETLQQWGIMLLTESLVAWTVFTCDTLESLATLRFVGSSRQIITDIADQLPENSEERLALYQNAIMILLLFGRVQNHECRREIEKQNMDIACKLARRASDAFFRKGTPATDALNRFHEKVGCMIERCSEKSSLAFLDYTVCRALHTDISIQRNDKADCKLDFLWEVPCQYGPTLTAVLRAYWLALFIKRVLGREHASMELDKTQFMDFVNQIASEVQEQSTALQTIPADQFTRVMKWFSSLSLHCTLYDFAKEAANNADQSSSSIVAIQSAARISISCIAPLFLHVAQSSSNQDLEPVSKPWEHYVEHICRGIIALDVVLQSSTGRSSSRMRRFADNSMQQMVQIIINSAPVASVEKAASILNKCGNMRDEGGNKRHAATPLLLTVLLYSSCEPRKASYQLDKRWYNLSKLFCSVDKPDLETMCILAALREKAQSDTGGGDRTRNDILALLSDKCYGNVPRLTVDAQLEVEAFANDKTIQSLVARICQLFQNRTDCTVGEEFDSKNPEYSGNECFTTQDLVQALLNDMANRQSIESFVQTKMGADFSLSTLCKGVLTPSQSTDTEGGMLEILMSIAERMALSISRKWQTFSYKRSIQELERILTHVKRFIFSSWVDEEKCFKEAAVALAYLSVATSLVSSLVIVEIDAWSWKDYETHDFPDDIVDTSVHYATLAQHCISSKGPHNVLQPVVYFYRLRLESKGSLKAGGLDAWIRKMREYGEYYTRGLNLKDNSFVNWSAECFCAFSMILSDWMMYLGEGVEALQLSSQNLMFALRLAAQTTQKRLQDALPWLEARILSFCSAEYAIPLMNDSCSESITVEDPSGTLLLTSRIRHDLLFSMDATCIDQHKQNLADFLTTTENQTTYVKNWVMSSIYLALADVTDQQGDFESALNFTRNAYLKATDCIMDCASSSLIHLSSFLLQNRILETLMRLANIYSELGERRKAESYASSSAQHLNTLLETDGRHAPAINVPLSKQEIRVQSLTEAIYTRKKPVDTIHVEMEFGPIQDCDFQQAHAMTAKCRYFDPAVLRKNEFLELLQKTEHIFGKFQDSDFTRQLALNLPAIIAPLTSSELVLSRAKSAFTAHGVCEHEKWNMVYNSCRELCQKPTTTRSCRCEAFYLMGLLYLQKSRESGSLANLWKDASLESEKQDEDGGGDCIAKARDSFRSALSLSGPASSVLTRNILRSLALVLGPESERSMDDVSSQALLQASIGASQCATIARMLSSGSEAQKHFHSLHNISCHKSEEFNEYFAVLNQLAPSNWTFICMALCPTGELLISKWEKSSDSECEKGKCDTTCIFGEERMYDALLKPLDNVLIRNQQQIDDTKARPPSTRDEVRDWWTTRKAIDSSLGRHLEEVESSWISGPVASLVFGKSCDHTVRTIESSSINLASKFADMADDENHDEESETISIFNTELMSALRQKLQALGITESVMDSFPESAQPLSTELKKLRVVDIKEILTDLDVTPKVVRDLRVKARLIDHLIEVLSRKATVHETSEREKKTTIRFLDNGSALQSTILILDEHLQRFPFESLPSLENKSVCRIPSLPFAVAKLDEIQGDASRLSIDPDHTSYVLDPESNLTQTRKRIDSALREMSTFNESMWDGVIGRYPSKQFMQQNLTQEQGLFLYFGHGDTKSFFSPNDLLGLQAADESGVCRRVKSSVVMMGCSSGRLQSIIQKDSLYTGEEQFLYYDPEGMAVSYLGAGAPCVIGNLWDVTDSDIDKYSIACMKDFFEGKNRDAVLSESVAKARSACKLRYITGAAPVCYGLPTSIW